MGEGRSQGRKSVEARNGVFSADHRQPLLPGPEAVDILVLTDQSPGPCINPDPSL